jgi:hypothetical protein
MYSRDWYRFITDKEYRKTLREILKREEITPFSVVITWFLEESYWIFVDLFVLGLGK